MLDTITEVIHQNCKIATGVYCHFVLANENNCKHYLYFGTLHRKKNKVESTIDILPFNVFVLGPQLKMPHSHRPSRLFQLCHAIN